MPADQAAAAAGLQTARVKFGNERWDMSTYTMSSCPYTSMSNGHSSTLWVIAPDSVRKDKHRESVEWRDVVEALASDFSSPDPFRILGDGFGRSATVAGDQAEFGERSWDRVWSLIWDGRVAKGQGNGGRRGRRLLEN